MVAANSSPVNYPSGYDYMEHEKTLSYKEVDLGKCLSCESDVSPQ